MHNQEVGVVDVELYGLEEILDCLLLSAVSVDEVFGGAAQHNLPCDANGSIFFEPDRRLLLVSVVEDYCNASFRDSGLTTFVDKILCVSVSKVQRCDAKRHMFLVLVSFARGQ